MCQPLTHRCCNFCYRNAKVDGLSVPLDSELDAPAWSSAANTDAATLQRPVQYTPNSAGPKSGPGESDPYNAGPEAKMPEPWERFADVFPDNEAESSFG